MYARIYDSENDRYYKSSVYGIFFRKGYVRRYIVLDPLTDRFILADRCDIGLEGADNVVVITPDNGDFSLFKGSWLRKYGDVIPRDEYSHFLGMSEVWRDESFIRGLFAEGSVRAEKVRFPLVEPPGCGEWEYIENQEQADEFTELFAGFHDASLDKLTYECDCDLRRITAVFDNSEWYGKAELCFDGVVEFHVCPPDHRRFSQYWSGSLCVNDKLALWAEGSGRNMDNYDKEFDYILAMSLRWRRITDF